MMRVFLTILFFISVFFAPWWLSVGIMVLLVARYEAYVEALIGMLVLDGVFGVSTQYLLGVEYLYTIVAIIIILCSLFMRRVMME